jgi:thiol-disulfide isomerase/thioredoxin
MKHVTVLLAVLVAFSAITAQGINFEHEGWEKIKKQAAKEDKIIFVDAYTTWCGPCKWMSANVFTDEGVADFFNDKFINLKLDMEKGEGLDFAKEYKVVAYPTLLFIDGDGDLVHKRLGAIPAEEFLAFGKEALDPEKRIGTLIAEYENGNRETEFLKMYVTRMVAAGMDPMESADLYFASLSDEEFITEENFNLILMLRPSMFSAHFGKVAENKDAFVAIVGEPQVMNFLKETSTSALLTAIYMDDDTSLQRIKSEVIAMDAPFTEEVVLFADMSQAQGEGEYSDFIEYADRYAKDYIWMDWNELNTIAWEIYEDEKYAGKDYLKLGLKLAKQSVAIEENYYNTDTYAALLYKSGKFKKAEEWAVLAIDHAKKEKMESTDTEKLLEKIQAALM